MKFDASCAVSFLDKDYVASIGVKLAGHTLATGLVYRTHGCVDVFLG
jgi:hypothetical protein